jgi:hypothetical protein
MKKTGISVLSAFCSSWAVVFLLVSTPRFGSADQITVDQLSDFMIENQGLNAEFIGRFFGPDESSPLVFSSNIDFSDLSFLFSLAPTTYLGQSLTLTGTGVFSPTTNLLTLSSAGSFGSQSWATTGTEVVTLSPDNLFSAAGDVDFLEGGVLLGDFDAQQFNRTDGSTGDFSVATDENGEQIRGTITVSTDTRTSSGNWNYQSTSTLGYVVNSTGFTPPAGGQGSFTTTIAPAPVPEPPSTSLIGSMVLAFFIVGRWRTRQKSVDKSIISSTH